MEKGMVCRSSTRLLWRCGFEVLSEGDDVV